MMIPRALLIAILAQVSACSRHYSDTALARCQIRWLEASESKERAWAQDRRAYFEWCMSSEDFEYDRAGCGGEGDNSYSLPRCYKSRQSLSYGLHHLGD